MTELEQISDEQHFETKKREAQLLENFKKHGHEIHVCPRRSNSVKKKLQDAITCNRELHDLVMRLNKEGQTFEELVTRALRYYEKNLPFSEFD